MVEEKEPPSPPPTPEESGESQNKRRRVMIEMGIAFLVIACVVLLWWWFVLRLEVSTDDAYVEGDLVAINTRQSGVVIAFYADNTDLVEEGQLLVEIDPTDYLLRYEEAKTVLALQTRRVAQLAEEVGENRQEVAQKSAELTLALYDFQNREPLAATGAISREEWVQYKTEVEVAEAALLLAEHALARSLAELGPPPLDEHPYITQAEEKMREAFLRVQRCRILAPTRGYVAMRNVQVGEFVDEMRNMMSVIPLDRVWVTANFKETELYWLRIGQPTHVEVDMYGRSVSFHGRVKGILGGTGAIFSLLPPQNATGNWIKIVQRVPVRIELDTEEILKHPLRLGLSSHTRIDIRNVEGEVLSFVPQTKRVLGTDVYRIPMESVEEKIQQIVEKNLR